jgi:hypothetical protein
MTPQDALNDTTPNGWLIIPAFNLVTFLSDEMIIGGVTERALTSTSGTPSLLSALRHRISSDDKEVQEAIQRLIYFTKNDAEFAKEEISDNFRRVRSHHLVAIWSAVETTIEHMLVNHIRMVPDADKIISAHVPTIKPRQIKRITIREANRTIRAWEGELSHIKELMEKQLEMLRVFGINITLDPSISRSLSEMSGLRNVIVHNAGLIDQPFLDNCPWRSDTVGDRVIIDQMSMTRWFDAAIDFAKKLTAATVSSTYFIKIS